MDDIFYFLEKNIQLFKSFNITKKTCKTVYYGSESLSSLALRIWELMSPKNMGTYAKLHKNMQTLREFKNQI